MPFLIIPLTGCGALTSRECGSVVSGKVTNSYWTVQDLPNLAFKILSSDCDGCLQAGPKFKKVFVGNIGSRKNCGVQHIFLNAFFLYFCDMQAPTPLHPPNPPALDFCSGFISSPVGQGILLDYPTEVVYFFHFIPSY